MLDQCSEKPNSPCNGTPDTVELKPHIPSGPCLNSLADCFFQAMNPMMGSGWAIYAASRRQVSTVTTRGQMSCHFCCWQWWWWWWWLW